ncbi:hypothetical protein FPV67DRAFT_1669772 [Lyophyllum atratum]|nr:hypothetical protein FPV67DRAFT_1669772 [Lyophyllum atratum]
MQTFGPQHPAKVYIRLYLSSSFHTLFAPSHQPLRAMSLSLRPDSVTSASSSNTARSSIPTGSVVPITEKQLHEQPSTTDADWTPYVRPTSSMDPIFTSEEYEAFARQFGTSVLISTFTATLIVAFLALARDIIDAPDTPDPVALIHFNIGMLLGMAATGLHIGVIVVAGRAAALCFRLSAAAVRDESKSIHCSKRLPSLEGSRHFAQVDFFRYIKYCDHLQLVASMMLLCFFLFLAYSMFTLKVFFWILFGASTIGGFSVFNTGFWKVSLAREAIRDTWNGISTRCCPQDGTAGTTADTRKGSWTRCFPHRRRDGKSDASDMA